MGVFSTIVRAGLHWLTAAMTLFAGLPAFECRCNAAPSQARSSRVTQTTGCCCGSGGQCCAPANPTTARDTPDPQKAEGECCCKRHHGRPADAPQDADGIRGRTCKQVIVQPDQYLVSAGASPVVRCDANYLVLPPEQPYTSPALHYSAAQSGWPAHPSVPPAKLRALLQRFLI